MTVTVDDTTSARGESHPSDTTPHEEVVPSEYYNVRFYGVLFLIIMTFFIIGIPQIVMQFIRIITLFKPFK